VSYHHRSFGNFRLTQNVVVSPSDFDQFCVTTPVDVRLPSGGGQQICGLYAVSTAKFGRNDNVITFANAVGRQTEIYDGVDVTMNARLTGRVILQGGLNTGRLKQNFCGVALPNISGIGGNPYPGAAVIPLASATTAFCEIRPPFLTQVKLLGVYQLPWWGIQTSATYQGLPGPAITASWAAPNALIAPSLGRNLPGGAANATIPLIPFGTLYGERMHQIDARVARSFKVARARLQPQLDVYNLANANPVLVLNNTFGPAWQQPLSILPGRIAKLGVQIDF
jgi:outer membrane receptor protein involved in Fe transport